MSTRSRYFHLTALTLLVAVAGCAAQPIAQHGPDTPGFLLGLWHGLVAPLAFVGSLFADIRMYAFPNSGGWYDFGWLLGVSAWGGGAATASR
jgi:hypothetical protein